MNTREKILFLIACLEWMTNDDRTNEEIGDYCKTNSFRFMGICRIIRETLLEDGYYSNCYFAINQIFVETYRSWPHWTGCGVYVVPSRLGITPSPEDGKFAFNNTMCVDFWSPEDSHGEARIDLARHFIKNLKKHLENPNEL